MADVHSTSDAPSVSYKDKLLQPSENDDLSHPSQAPKRKLPPTKDEGSPPMTIKVPDFPAQAPAGADDISSPDLRSSSWSHSTSDKPEALRSSSLGTPWSPRGSTQSAIDARHKFRHSASGRQAAVQADYVLKDGAVPCPQPQHVDDYPSDEDVPQPEGWDEQESKAAAAAGSDKKAGEAPTSVAEADALSQEAAQINIAEAGPSAVAGTVLSDIEQQVISDPSTADLVAATTQSDATSINPEPPKANVVQPDSSSDVKGIQGDISAVLPAGGAAAGAPIVTQADADAEKGSGGYGKDVFAAAAAGGGGGGGNGDARSENEFSPAQRAHSTIGGEILGMPIRIMEASDAAGLSMKLPAQEQPADVDRNAPGKAFGMETETTSDSRRSCDSSTHRADSLFTGGGRIFTASDAAAAGLANLAAEADAAAESGKQGSGTTSDTDAADSVGEGGILGDTAAGGTAGGTMGGTFGATPGDNHSEVPGDTAAAGEAMGATSGDSNLFVQDALAIRAPGTPDIVSEVGDSSSAAVAPQELYQGEPAAPGIATGGITRGTAAAAAGEVVHEDVDAAEGGDTEEKHSSGLNPFKAVGAAISKMADLVVGPDVAADLDLPGSESDDKQQQPSDGIVAEV